MREAFDVLIMILIGESQRFVFAAMSLLFEFGIACQPFGALP